MIAFASGATSAANASLRGDAGARSTSVMPAEEEESEALHRHATRARGEPMRDLVHHERGEEAGRGGAAEEARDRRDGARREYASRRR